MFVELEELKYAFKNVKAINKIGLKSLSGLAGFLIFFVAVLFQVLTPLIMFDKDTVVYVVQTQDWSVTLLGSMLVLALIMEIFCFNRTIKSTNIFPQTNNSMFISNKMNAILQILILTFFVNLVYVITHLLFVVFTNVREKTFMLSSFDFDVLLFGTVVFIAYSALIYSAAILIGAVIRKLKLYALVFPIVVIGIGISDLQTLGKIAIACWDFYCDESSILMFLLKIIVSVILLNLVAYILNYFTLHNESTKINLKVLTVVIVVAVITSIAVFGFVFANVTFSSIGSTEEHLAELEELDFEELKIEIDTSNLENGTVLNIKGNENVVINDDAFNYGEGSRIYIETEDGKDNITVAGDTLVIYYSRTRNTNYDEYVQRNLEANIEGDTLYINYDYQGGITLLRLNQYTILRQFDRFKDIKSTYDFENSIYSESRTLRMYFE